MNGVTVIESHQPFSTHASAPLESPLAGLATLSNADKHRQLWGSFVYPQSVSLTVSVNGKQAVVIEFEPVNSKVGQSVFVGKLRFDPIPKASDGIHIVSTLELQDVIAAPPLGKSAKYAARREDLDEMMRCVQAIVHEVAAN